jgi:flagellar protein FlaI
VKSNYLGGCRTNIWIGDEDFSILLRTIEGRAGMVPTMFNPSIEGYDRSHRPILRISIDAYDTTVRPSMSIRTLPSRPWKIIDMVGNGTVMPRLGAWLWLLLQDGVPVLVIGVTGSGKTSLTASLMSALPPWSVIAKVEDVDEVVLPQELVPEYASNVVTLLSREPRSSGIRPIPLFTRLLHALRRGVDYIMVNEVRSPEDLRTWLHGILTGQAGGATSLHARDVGDALTRLRDYGAPLESMKMVIVSMRKREDNGLVRRSVGEVHVLDRGNLVRIWPGGSMDAALLGMDHHDPGEVNAREAFLRNYSGADLNEREWLSLLYSFYRARGIITTRGSVG